jgi:hypothetical protein
MSTPIGTNLAKQKLAANDLVLCFSWLLKLGVRYLTSGSDTLYILSGGRADVKQIREVAAGASAGTL